MSFVIPTQRESITPLKDLLPLGLRGDRRSAGMTATIQCFAVRAHVDAGVGTQQ